MTIQTPVFVGNQADDGAGDKLRDAFIKVNERLQQIAALFQNKGTWAAGTQYVQRDYVYNAGTAYVCVIDHTASATFATDMAAGKWANVDALDLRLDLASSTTGKGASMVYDAAKASELASTATGKGANLVSFEGGGNVQDLRKSAGSSLVGFIQSGTGAVARTALDKMRDFVSVKDFGAVGDGVTDDTAAIQAAINTYKSVYFPRGAYLTGPLTIPTLASGNTYFGDGANYYQSGTNIRGTLLLAKDANQPHIFAHANGADSIMYRGMRLDGNSQALKLVDGTYGAWITLHDCKLQRYVDYGFYNRQGLARIENCYFHTLVYSGLGIGASLYSDWNITNSEFSNGNIPLEIVAGGGRGVNVLANSGRTTCVRLAPLSSSTSHINTSFTNCYFGEVVSGAVSSPVVQMIGLPSQIIQQVQFSNSHIVSARTAETDKINGGIYMDYCREISISGVVMLGLANSGVTATRYVDYFVKGIRSSFVNITGCVTKSVSNNSVFMDTACYGWNIVGNNFAEFAQVAAVIGAADDGAAIKITDTANYGVIANNSFDCSGASTAPMAVYGGNPSRFVFSGNQIRYPGTTIWSPTIGFFAGNWRRMGDVSDSYQSVKVISSAWDAMSSAGEAAFRLGAYRLWVDSSGKLRIKSGAPTSDTDGAVVGTQT